MDQSRELHLDRRTSAARLAENREVSRRRAAARERRPRRGVRSARLRRRRSPAESPAILPERHADRVRRVGAEDRAEHGAVAIGKGDGFARRGQRRGVDAVEIESHQCAERCPAARSARKEFHFDQGNVRRRRLSCCLRGDRRCALWVSPSPPPPLLQSRRAPDRLRRRPSSRRSRRSPNPSLPPWIVSISPTSKAQTLAQIRVIFAKPVAPVAGALRTPGRATSSSHVTHRADARGHFTVLTPRMIGFVADQALPIGTRVRVTLGAGLEAISPATRSRADLAWTFETEPLDAQRLAAARRKRRRTVARRRSD